MSMSGPVRIDDLNQLRADHVGSLLRPERLLDARRARESGQIGPEAFRQIEQDCIAAAVKLQEDAGFRVVTDGDYPRTSFHIDFLTQLGGVIWQPARFVQGFADGQNEGHSPAVFAVNAPVRHLDPIALKDYEYVQSVSHVTAKVTMPSPSFVHCRGGRAAISAQSYPDLDVFFADLAAAYRAEIAALAKAGCRYVQLDEVHFTFLCDPVLVEGFRARGDDPQALARTYAKLINDSIADRPADMLIGVHLCRGNHRSGWVAQGGYEPVADLLFNTVNADRFLLEFDTERAGGFEPLRFVPRNKVAVLGLVTTKTDEMESPDLLRRRLDEAARYLPLEQLALSPQCGFASSIPGNRIGAQVQWAKLRMIADLARQTWGHC